MTEPSNQVITTETEPTPMSPLTRWIRTALQVAVAFAAAVPALAAIFDVSAELTAKLTAGMGVLVALVSAIHNAFNARQSTEPLAYAHTHPDQGDITVHIVLCVVGIVCGVLLVGVGIGAIAITGDSLWTIAGVGIVSASLAGLV